MLTANTAIHQRQKCWLQIVKEGWWCVCEGMKVGQKTCKARLIPCNVRNMTLFTALLHSLNKHLYTERHTHKTLSLRACGVCVFYAAHSPTQGNTGETRRRESSWNLIRLKIDSCLKEDNISTLTSEHCICLSVRPSVFFCCNHFQLKYCNVFNKLYIKSSVCQKTKCPLL